MALALLAPAPAWTTISQSTYGATLAGLREMQHHNRSYPIHQTLGFLWTLPEDANDLRGLGGGIAYAWDPQLCSALIPKFREDIIFFNLVACEDLRAALSRSMASWAAQHEFINFVDVTEECAKLQGDAMDDSCPLVELWITRKPASQATNADVAASALPITRRVPDSTYSKFRYTNGLSPYYINSNGDKVDTSVFETYRGKIEFGIDGLCWYLDATFCSYFHQMKAFADAQTIRFVLQLIIFVLWGTAGILIVYQIASAVRIQCDRHESKSCRTRCRKSLEELASWSLLGTALRVVLIVSPSLFYVNIFLPCWECYDFEASALHEVGHILGLGHPDRANEEQAAVCASCGCCGPADVEHNLYSVASSAANVSDACVHTFDYVFQGLPPGTPSDDLVQGVRQAIMISFTQFNSQPCLAPDDLEALNTLYPTCGPVISDFPSCYPVRHNIGWVRVMIYVLLPGLAAMIFMLCIGSYFQKEAAHRLNSARNLLHKKSIFVRQAHEEGELHRMRAEQALATLQAHRETEEARVEMEVQERMIRLSVCDSFSGAEVATMEPAASGAGVVLHQHGTPLAAPSDNPAPPPVEQRNPLMESCSSSISSHSLRPPRGYAQEPSSQPAPRPAPPPYYNPDRNSEESGWLARLGLSSKRV